MHCRDRVVLAVENPTGNKMLVAKNTGGNHTVNEHAGMAMTGFVSDGRQTVNRAREEASSYDGT